MACIPHSKGLHIAITSDRSCLDRGLFSFQHSIWVCGYAACNLSVCRSQVTTLLIEYGYAACNLSVCRSQVMTLLSMVVVSMVLATCRATPVIAMTTRATRITLRRVLVTVTTSMIHIPMVAGAGVMVFLALVRLEGGTSLLILSNQRMTLSITSNIQVRIIL